MAGSRRGTQPCCRRSGKAAAASTAASISASRESSKVRRPSRAAFISSFVVTYRRTGLPPFELRGEEWDFFRDGKLEFHREKLANVADGLEFLKRHAKELLPMR